MKQLTHPSPETIATFRPLAERFFALMRHELEVEGIELELPDFDRSELSLCRDNPEESEVLLGHFEASDGCRMGSWLVRADGGGFADLDIMMRHPDSPDLFVESISVFSSGAELSCRLRCREVGLPRRFSETRKAS